MHLWIPDLFSLYLCDEMIIFDKFVQCPSSQHLWVNTSLANDTFNGNGYPQVIKVILISIHAK